MVFTEVVGAAFNCKKKGGPTGKGKVVVTFSKSGKATEAKVSAPFTDTDVGKCAEDAFKNAEVPAFKGNDVTVAKSFVIK